MAKIRINGIIHDKKGDPFGCPRQSQSCISVLAKKTLKKLRKNKPPLKVVGKIKVVNESISEGSYRNNFNYYVEESYRSGGKKKKEFKGFKVKEMVRIAQMTSFGKGVLDKKRVILEEDQEMVLVYKKITKEMKSGSVKPLKKKLEWNRKLPNREIVEETFPGMRIAQLAKAKRDESVEEMIAILKKREQEEDAALKELIPAIGLDWDDNSAEEMESSSNLQEIAGPSEPPASTSEKDVQIVDLDDGNMSPKEMKSPSVVSEHMEEIVTSSGPSEPSVSTSKITILMIKLDPDDDMSSEEMLSPSKVSGHMEEIAANSESSASSFEETTPSTELGAGATFPEELTNPFVVPEHIEEIGENSESSEAMTPRSDMTSDASVAELWSPSSPAVSDTMDKPSSDDSKSLEEIDLTVEQELEIPASGIVEEATEHLGSSLSASTSGFTMEVSPILIESGPPSETLPGHNKQFYNPDGLALRLLECNGVTLVSGQGSEHNTGQLPNPDNYSSFTPVDDQSTRHLTSVTAEHHNLENHGYSYNCNRNYIINRPSCNVTSTNERSRTRNNLTSYPRAALYPKTEINEKPRTRRNYSGLLEKSRRKEPELVVLD